MSGGRTSNERRTLSPCLKYHCELLLTVLLCHWFETRPVLLLLAAVVLAGESSALLCSVGQTVTDPSAIDWRPRAISLFSVGMSSMMTTLTTNVNDSCAVQRAKQMWTRTTMTSWCSTTISAVEHRHCEMRAVRASAVHRSSCSDYSSRRVLDQFRRRELPKRQWQ